MIDRHPLTPDWLLELAESERGVSANPPRVYRDPMSAIERLRYWENRQWKRDSKVKRERRVAA